MGFIGVAVGLIIGILIYSEVNAAIDCPTVADDADGNAACERAKSIAWTVISILPISMFFALYSKQLILIEGDSPFSVDSAEQSLNHDIAHDNFSHVKECNLNQSESVQNACDRAETFGGKVVV